MIILPFLDWEDVHPRLISTRFSLILSQAIHARKIERFLSQPMRVAEQFTGRAGRYVPREETVRGFKEILEG